MKMTGKILAAGLLMTGIAAAASASVPEGLEFSTNLLCTDDFITFSEGFDYGIMPADNEGKEYYSPLLNIVNNSGETMQVNLSAVIDGYKIKWDDIMLDWGGSKNSISKSADPNWNALGWHSAVYSLNGEEVASFRWLILEESVLTAEADVYDAPGGKKLGTLPADAEIRRAGDEGEWEALWYNWDWESEYGIAYGSEDESSHVVYVSRQLVEHALDLNTDDMEDSETLQKALAGDGEAMCDIAATYFDGDGVDKNLPKAFSWYYKAAQAGNLRGMRRLGYRLEDGEGCAKDVPAAITWFEKAADLGDMDSIEHLGFIYRQGDIVTADYDRARKWLQKGVDAEDGYCMYVMGYMAQHGEGGAVDLDAAESWFRKAYDAGSYWGALGMGQLYEYSDKKDYAQAMDWYQKAAEAGYARGMYEVGCDYRDGTIVEKDTDEAIRWFEKAAENDYSKAFYQLAKLYREKQEYAKALEWAQKGVDKGISSCMHLMGLLYRDGQGVEADISEAEFWLTKAIEAGDSDAEDDLNNLYSDM